MYSRIIIISLVLTGFFMIPIQAQQNTPVKRGGGKMVEQTSTRGSDPEVKENSRVNTEGARSESFQPMDKGGDAMGSSCDVYIDNHTNLLLDIYIDGRYKGSVADWGSGTKTVSGGLTTVYVKAEFPNGAFYYWGPVTFDCDDETFTFNVYNGRYTWYKD